MSSDSISLSVEALMELAAWAADCAQRALPVYEASAHSDSRPRAAIAGARDFARNGQRTATLRTLAWDAYAAAREADNPAAAAAARAAGLVAGTAYTHPIATPHQSKHILGPAAYAALAIELDRGDPSSDSEIRWAIEHATAGVREILLQMPPRLPGKSRLDEIFYALDAGIRGQPVPQES